MSQQSKDSGYMSYVKYAVGVYVTYSVLNYGHKKTKQALMKRKAQAKRMSILKLPVNLPVQDQTRSQWILCHHAYELARLIRKKQVSSVEVLTAFADRAKNIGRKLNLTADELWSDAMKDAQAADQMLQDNPESCGPLHGVPMSIKDQFAMKGTDRTHGLAKFCNQPDDFDCVLVKCLRKAGVVPFVKSNIPQFMMWIESENQIFGRCNNPWDEERTTGGSSGGEGGLVASRCSPLGLGSDIGGSIRCPAAWCGVYGFKPSANRVSRIGAQGASDSRFCLIETHVPFSSGPMGTCVEDLVLVMQAIISDLSSSLDPYVLPISFNTATYEATQSSRNLKIGYFSDNGFFQSSPPVVRSINEAKEKLEGLGHTLVPFQIPDMEKWIIQLFRIYFSAGAEQFEALGGEKEAWFYSAGRLEAENPRLKPLLHKLACAMGFKRAIDIVKHTDFLSAYDYVQEYDNLMDYKTQFLEYWKSLELDALICPAMATPAPQHRGTEFTILQASYCMIFNYLNFPAGVVPVTQVRSDEMTYGGIHNDGMDRECEKIMEGSAGMPICVQVACPTNEDEKVLGVMKQIQEQFKFHKTAI